MTTASRNEPEGPRHDIGRLLSELQALTESGGVSLHRLSLTTGAFERHPSSIGSTSLPLVRWDSQLSKPDDVSGISPAAARKLGEGLTVQVEQAELIPVTRSGVLVAFVEIVSPRGRLAGTPGWRIQNYQDRLRTLLEQRFILRLLDNMQVPIDFTQDWDTFIADEGDLIELATHMEFIALRELERESLLTAILVRGFDSDRTEDFAIARSDPHGDLFWSAFDGDAVPVDSVDLARLQSIRKFAPNVRSFVVCPMAVGGEQFGTLSFGASCEYRYSSVELRGLEALSQAIGVSVANFRNHHEKSAAFRDESAISVKVTAYEVAQSARHEARAVLGSLQDTIVALGTELDSIKASEALKLVDDIDDGLQRIDEALNKIRDAGSAKRLAVEQISLSQLWNGARSLTTGRLNALRVKVDPISGPDLVLRVPVDWMREVFVHLLLNSLDAFKEREHRNKGRRSISLRVDKWSDKDETVDLYYTDNAGGLQIAKIRALAATSEDADVRAARPEQAIFMRDFTTRDAGSGHGLYVTRRILREHCGKSSIDYVSSVSDSAQFRIALDRAVIVG